MQNTVDYRVGEALDKEEVRTLIATPHFTINIGEYK
jgi:hypothetical protein